MSSYENRQIGLAVSQEADPEDLPRGLAKHRRSQAAGYTNHTDHPLCEEAKKRKFASSDNLHTSRGGKSSKKRTNPGLGRRSYGTPILKLMQ